jgi:large repetitive protein
MTRKSRRPRRNQLRLERLEDRRLLVAAVDLAAITGLVFKDTTGNGFNAGEQVAGAALDLYVDNGNGQFDRGVDSTIMMTMSNSDGRYSFSRLTARNYFVVQQANALLGLQEKVSPLITISSEDIKGRITTTIDNFNTATQSVSDTTQGNGPETSIIAANNSDVIGGERDLFANKTSQNGAVQLEVNSSLLPGQLIFSSPATGVGDRRITWDGVDGDATTVNDTGLSNVNLANNAEGIQLQIRADQGGVATLRIYSNDNNAATANRFSFVTIPIPETVGTFLSAEFFPFTGFQAAPGGAADFANVTAIELEITGGTEVDGAAELIGAVGLTELTQDFDNFETANLNLTKTVNLATPNVGQEVTFRITVNNAGPSNATGVQVSDVLPAGISFVRSNTVNGSYNSTTGVWNVGAIANGSAATLDLVGRVDQIGTKTNTAQITASNQFDANAADNQASVDVTPPSVDLSLSKVASNQRPNRNDDVTFTVTVNNSGTSTATNVAIRDQLPSGLTLRSAVPARGSFNTTSGVWTIPSIAPGESLSLPIVATVSSVGAFANTAEVIAVDQFDTDSTPNNGVATEDDIATDTVTTPTANLSLTKQANNLTPNVGEPVTFTIRVTNAGPDPATGVQVTDRLPSGLTDNGSNVDVGTYLSNTGLWNIGNLAVNETATLTIFAIVDANNFNGNPIVNTAQVTAADQADANSTPNNNVATEDDQAAVTIDPPTVDLAVTKTIDKARPNVGDEILYTINISNNGPDEATGVIVRDLLPAGLTLLAANQTANGYNQTSGDWNVGTLASGVSTTLTLRARIDSSTPLTNTASVQTVNQFDTNTINNQATVGFTLASSDLALTKTVDNGQPSVGEVVNFRITVTNAGPDPATGVSIRDQLPAGTTFVSAVETAGNYDQATGIWTINALAVNGSATLTLRATALVTDLVTNTATVTAVDQSDPNQTNNEATAALQGRQIDLSLTKTISNARPNVGDDVTFLITVRNDGPSDATGVAITDTLPAGVTLTNSLPSRGSFNTTTRVWTLGSLAIGQEETLQLTTRIDRALTTATNVAQVTAANEPDSDSTPNNNVETEDDQQTVSFSTPVADLVLAKRVNNSAPNVGDTVTFTVELTNNGPDVATNIVVADLLPSGLNFASNSLSIGDYTSSTGNWVIDQLAIGQVATLNINAEVSSRGEKINTARVLSVDQFDPTSTPGNNVESEDDQDSATVTPPVIDLALRKTASPSRPSVGDVVTFVLTATNAGPSNATGVVVTDVLPNGLAFVDSQTTAGSYNVADGRWNIGPIDSGQSVSLELMATVNSAGEKTNVAEVTSADQFDSDSTPANNDANEDDRASVVVTPASADLSLTKSSSTLTPNLGDTVVFTLTVSNAGPDAVTDVMVRDVLPAGLTFVSQSPSTANFNSTTGVWTIPAINSGATASLEIRATVDSTGDKINAAEIITSSEFDPDSTPGNGDPTEDDQAAVTLTPQLVDLALTKMVDDPQPNVGDSIAYLLTLTNAGPSTATGVAVMDQLPSGVLFEDAVASQGSYNSQTGIWTVGSVASGATPTLRLNVTVGNTRGETNTAEVSAVDQPDSDSTPANNVNGEDDQASAMFTTQVANLSLQKTVDNATPNQNQNVNFTLQLSNAGPDNASAVRVRDLLPPGLVFVSSDPSTGSYDPVNGIWSLPNVPVGTSASLIIQARVDLLNAASTALINTAEVAAVRQFDPNSTPGNGVAGEDDQATVTVAPPVVDIAVLASTDNATPLEDEVITLTFSTSNSGNVNATGVIVSALLPAGLTILSAQPQTGSYDPTTGVWNIGSIAAGNTTQLIVTARVDERGLKQIPVAVLATDQFDIDSVPGNNVPTEDDQTELVIRAPRLLTKRLFLSR